MRYNLQVESYPGEREEGKNISSRKRSLFVYCAWNSGGRLDGEQQEEK